MAITLGSNSISGIGVGGLPAGSVNASSLATTTRQMKFAYNATTGSFGGGGDSGWQNSGRTVSFTVTEAGSSVHCWFCDVAGYEEGAGNGWTRFHLTGATDSYSYETNSLMQGHAANYAYGSQKTHFVFTGVNAGAHTLYLEYRQYNATAYWGYFNGGGQNRTCNTYVMVGYY